METLHEDLLVGDAITQAVCRRLPTAKDPYSSLSKVMWDLWWTKRHWEQVSSEYFGFPRQSFHRLLHTHPGAGTIGQIMIHVSSGLNFTPFLRSTRTCVISVNTFKTIRWLYSIFWMRGIGSRRTVTQTTTVGHRFISNCSLHAFQNCDGFHCS
jgi:hypothetical protein